MATRGWTLTMVALVMVTLVLSACAKRPATTQASAPAPTGAAGTTGGSPPGTVPSPTAARPSAPAGPATAAPSAPSTPSGPSVGAGQPGTAGPSGPSAGAAATPAPGSGAAGETARPATATAPRPEPQEFRAVPELKAIYFDFDKYDIRPDDAKILDGNAAWLKQNAGLLVLIEGHCDERGTNEYNLALGERRAKATMNYLVSQGVQASRITVISYGEERPVCTEKNEACWSKNRRSQFLVKPR
jgi:peptidoglycan-associated lipoprotein